MRSEPIWSKRVRMALILLALTGAVPIITTAAFAADTDPLATAKRVGKLESEMRAVQRKVFPGGDAKFFTPDISSAPVAAPAEPSGNPSSAPINDLTARVDALERQLRMLTGQVEENQNTLKHLDTTVTKLRGDTEFRLTKLEGSTSAAPSGQPGAGSPPSDTKVAAGNGGLSSAPALTDGLAAGPAKSAAASATKTGGKASAAANKASTKPPTGDPVETAWRAARAYYTAKDYDAAETGFTDFVAGNPKSSHASTAQYLLGRSYAAQTSSAQAAKAFLDGYQKYPKSEQAPDSLIGLGNALTALKKPDQACRALNELKSVYGSKLTTAQKAQAAKARTSAKCES
jgi:tol-pal system protein YbgF